MIQPASPATNGRPRSRRRGRHVERNGIVRVAAYCRVSTDERLNQEFNSLDNQRAAIESYIASQAGVGWQLLEARYDDGGFSGANTDRPALQQLLRDIEAGKVDLVAVYRADRLSRKILDLFSLLEVFQAHDVAFVSVTEHFDTSTVYGRGMLGMLATFAQMERETIAERTRDKILATRRKGMWTGGMQVLGYDLREKKLIVNEAEAKRVREIFELYSEIGSLREACRELNRRGWKTKSWTTQKGTMAGGKPWNHSKLRTFLSNPVYLGKLSCAGEVYEAQHEAIVDKELWDAVQAKLAENASSDAPRHNQSWDALLGGLARCAVCDAALGHTYSSRGSRKNRYYVCQTIQKEGASACPGSRVKAVDLEGFVLDHVREMCRQPEVVDATLEAAKDELHRRRKAKDTDAAELKIDDEDLRDSLDAFEPLWQQLTPPERCHLLQLLVERVTYDDRTGDVAITFLPDAPAMEALNGANS